MKTGSWIFAGEVGVLVGPCEPIFLLDFCDTIPKIYAEVRILYLGCSVSKFPSKLDTWDWRMRFIAIFLQKTVLGFKGMFVMQIIICNILWISLRRV